MKERVWSMKVWNSKELQIIRFIPTLIIVPLSLFASSLSWLGEVLEYTVVTWLDKRVDDLCWYYIKVKKKILKL
jgi:hypothetical protein